MTPKYRTIYEQIKSDILAGVLAPGDKVPSERVLAKVYKTGVVTAARALHELARSGYVVREVGRGTFVADPAVVLHGKASSAPGGTHAARRLGFLVLGRHWDDPSYARMIRLLVQGATERRCVASCWELEDAEIPKGIRNELADCDTLVVLGSGCRNAVAELLWLGIPLTLVAIRPIIPESADKADHVFCRYDEAAGLAVEHLVGLGHRRIALINGTPQDDRNYSDFSEGYRAALAWRQIHFDPDLLQICSNPTDSNEGYACAARLLGLADGPSAVVCASDRIAYGVCRAAARSGLSIPQDLSVVGGEDLPTSRTFSPNLTVVHHTPETIACKAIELVMMRLDDPGRGQAVIELRPKLTVRQSTGPALTETSPGDADLVTSQAGRRRL